MKYGTVHFWTPLLGITNQRVLRISFQWWKKYEMCPGLQKCLLFPSIVKYSDSPSPQIIRIEVKTILRWNYLQYLQILRCASLPDHVNYYKNIKKYIKIHNTSNWEKLVLFQDLHCTGFAVDIELTTVNLVWNVCLLLIITLCTSGTVIMKDFIKRCRGRTIRGFASLHFAIPCLCIYQ